MLLEDFYHITHFNPSGDKLSAGIRLNPKHEIYKGHFPDQPVVPGVVQLQIIKELFEKVVLENLMMTEVIQAKYLRMITPEENQLLTIDLKWVKDETGKYLLNASVFDNEQTFTKLRAKLSKPAEES